MHSKISLGSLSLLRTKCRFLDLNVCLFVCFPYYSWHRKAKDSGAHGWIYWAQGKREQEGLHECAGSAQGCAFPRCLSLSNAMPPAEVGSVGWDGRPRFPSPTAPTAEGSLGTPFHPSLLQEGCADFHQKIQVRDHLNKSFITGTGDSETGWHSRHREGPGEQPRAGGVRVPRREAAAHTQSSLELLGLMQTRHLPQNNYHYGRSQGLGWDRAPYSW